VLIEAFSAARDPADDTTNEDALVVLPGRAYAVIDGVTDRSGLRYDGMLSGRFAARLIARELEREFDDTMLREPARVIEPLTTAMAEVYARHGDAEAARADWGRRIAATLTLVTTDEDAVRVVLVGDSGVRLNGDEVVQLDKDIDRITSALRAHGWHLAASRTEDAEQRERAARALSRHGTAQDAVGLPPPLLASDLPALHAAVLAECLAAMPHLAAEVVSALLAGGILHGQGMHQNNADSPLGYSALDGFAVPASLIRTIERPRAAVATIELFTDGYFEPGKGFGVPAWEAAFREVERCDAEKVRAYAAPKGSTPQLFADDRSYLGVRL
jgi:hypothetical protein